LPLACLRPSVSSTAICPLYGPLPLNDPMSPVRRSARLRNCISYMALCLLYSPLTSLRHSVPYITFCPLYGPVFPLWPSVQFFDPYSLYDSVPSTVLAYCFLDGSLSL
jgi:hypothetical protein